MNKIYIEYDKTTGEVTYQNFFPLDPVNGIKKQDGTLYTETELLAKGGIFVDSVPEPDSTKIQTQDATLYVNLTDKSLYYVYADRPQTQEQIMTTMQNNQAQVLLALVTAGLM